MLPGIRRLDNLSFKLLGAPILKEEAFMQPIEEYWCPPVIVFVSTLVIITEIPSFIKNKLNIWIW